MKHLTGKAFSDIYLSNTLHKGKWKQKDLCDCGTKGAVTPEQRATNRRTKTQRELERRERYRDALVGRRVGLKYDDDLEEYTGVVACRAFGIYNGSGKESRSSATY